MTRDEIKIVMAAAAAIDPMIPAPHKSILDVWETFLADVPGHVGEKAVFWYYRSDAYADHKRSIAPADIFSFWKRSELDARKREAAAEITAARAAIEAAPRELPSLNALVARFNAERRGEDPDIAEGEAGARRLFMNVTCPRCKARPGQGCTSYNGRPLRKSPAHPVREEAAMKAFQEGRKSA